MDQHISISIAEIQSLNTLVGKVALSHKVTLRAFIDWFNITEGCCRTSLERMAESAGVSMTTFRAHLAQLQADGWIVRADKPGSPPPGLSTIHWRLDLPRIRAALEPMLKQQSEEHRRKRPKYSRAERAALEARKASELAKLRAENEVLRARLAELEKKTVKQNPKFPQPFNLDVAEKV